MKLRKIKQYIMTNKDKLIALLEEARELAKTEFESRAEFTYKLKHPKPTEDPDQKWRRELDQLLDDAYHLGLTDRARLQASNLVNEIFDEVERIKTKYDLNPHLFKHADGTADNLSENHDFYDQILTPYEWRCFRAASLLIDKTR